MFDSLRRTVLATILLVLPVCLLMTSARAQTGVRYTNVVNDKFATVSSGPQSSLIVDVKASDTQAATDAAINKRLKADWKTRSRSLSGSIAQLRKAGLLKGKQAFPISTLIAVRKNGEIVVPTRSRTRSVGNGDLTFKFTNFSSPDRDFLQRLIDLAYPRLVELYGKPAVSGEVEVVNLGDLDNGTGTDVQRLAFGGYDVSNNRILLPIYESVETFAQAFLLNMVHAFHGPAVFQYDAWEQGFARAAAAIISRQPEFGFSDGSANNLYSLLQFYDVLNQPGLGNPTFFPPSQLNLDFDTTSGGFTLGKMIFPRMGMSGAAWLKVYIENQSFFKQFNEAYYAQFDPVTNPGVAGNVPVLKSIAASFLPNGVEGLAFDDWYRRQYVLDTSIAPGRKLYATVLPGEVTSDKGQAHLIQLVYYRTKADGDEELINGRAYATYFDQSNARLNLGIASEQTDLVDGEGSITTQSNQTQGVDAGRLTMDFHVNNDTARAYITSGFSGDFQAVVLGADATGDIKVRQTTINPVQTREKTGAIEGSAFSVNLGTQLNDLTITTVEVTEGGVTQTFRINTGDGRYFAVLRPNAAGGGVTTATRVYPVTSAPYLVSFPVRPLATAVDSALGISASDFALSYWDPVRSVYESVTPNPATSASPIQPGRGYWLKFLPADPNVTEVRLDVVGVAPNTDTDYTVTLPFGWNLVGNPFNQAIDVSKLLVQYLQNDAISWDEAVTRNLVAAQPYDFAPSVGYTQIDTLDGENWRGVWMRVLVPGGVTILLPGPDSPTTRSVRITRAVTTKPARPDWSVHLRAQQRGENLAFGGVATATFGTSRAASKGFDNRYDREMPPPVVNAVQVEFPHSDWGKSAGGRYVADFRESSRRATWQVNVTAVKEGLVQLSWDNLGTLPRTTRLTLVDKESGERVALKSRSTYTYTATATKLTRAFEVISEPSRSTPLMLTNITMTRVPGRAADGGRRVSIAYTVTDDAEVSVEVNALSGRLVRRIGSSRSRAAGRDTLLWDGRAQEGGALPAGTYTVRLTAKTSDGGLVTVVRPIILLN